VNRPLSERPAVVALDVNETLSDMRPLGARLEDVGAPAHLLATWFAGALRDGFALTAAGAYSDFATVARAALQSNLAGVDPPTREPEAAARYVLAGIDELPLHSDVHPGLVRLHDAGVRLVTLTNGSARTSQLLLERGGAAELVECHISVEAVRRWKPAPEPYLHAAHWCGVTPGQLMLTAVHPWDVDGAKRAGLAACWINRTGAPYPISFAQPDVTCGSLVELAGSLTA
jgi:2-haloacid dehalogenase